MPQRCCCNWCSHFLFDPTPTISPSGKRKHMYATPHRMDPSLYDHPQVLFTTLRGVETTVDEGLFIVLTMLKKLGVETQYSCQGDEYAAYVCAKAFGFDRLVRDIRRLSRSRRLSRASRKLVSNFESAHRKFEFNHWSGRGTSRQKERRIFYTSRTLGKNMRGKKQRFSFERSISKRYGHRITVRWPVGQTPAVERLLSEVLAAR
jgi:hypothetical protein